MIRTVRRGGTRVLLPFLLVLAVFAAGAASAAGPAAAAPPGPTMSLDALRTAIDASPGGVTGYFKTVLQGATISDVPVKILAVVDGANEYDGTPLIMFQITDPTVLAEGGLAEGMSGSPLYVSDGDELVGGVSYGYYLTTNGLGLATPIDLMASIESDYPVAPVTGAGVGQNALAGPTSLPLRSLPQPALPKARLRALPHPVSVAGHTYRRLLIARSVRAAHALTPTAGTAVVVPLTALEVGGLPLGSQAFKKLAADLEKHGVNVVGAQGGPGSSDFSADLVGGASVAAVLASGNFWAFYIGTVTYADGDNVVAFGHPTYDQFGATSLGMANARVYGIWSALDVPFKMASLGALRGTITQDRRYGMAGSLAATPPQVKVNASATVPLTSGTRTVDTTTVMPRFIADSLDYGSEFLADACYMPVMLAADSYNYPGYETTHVTIDVTDQADVHSTVTRDNVFDDTYDVGFAAGWEIYNIVDQLLLNDNGTAPATLQSVDFSATLSPAHHSTKVIDFSIPGGLRVGSNPVHVVLRDYGQVATRTLDTSINIPRGLDRSGEIDVYGTPDAYGGDDYYFYEFGASSLGSNVDPPQTVADVVADINAWPLNNAVFTDFYSNDSGPTGEDGIISSPGTPVTDGGADRYVNGYVAKETASMRLRAARPFYLPGMTVRLRGLLDAWDAVGTRVALYRGAATKPFATVPVRYDSDSGSTFFTVTAKNVRKTTMFRAVWDGSDQFIGARTSCKVHVLR